MSIKGHALQLYPNMQKGTVRIDSKIIRRPRLNFKCVFYA
jgi:hypothetical protein